MIFIPSFMKISSLMLIMFTYDGVLGFDSRRELGILLFTTASRTALGPTQPPSQWVPGALSLGIKRPGREADHSHLSSAEVKECVKLYLHSPNTYSWRGAWLSTGTTLPFLTFKMYAIKIGCSCSTFKINKVTTKTCSEKPLV
jgi:hypothetical protein